MLETIPREVENKFYDAIKANSTVFASPDEALPYATKDISAW